MSSHKTKFTSSEAEDFLNSYFKTTRIKVESLSGGEESKAFVFDFKDSKYVLRVTWHGVLGYQKDKIAYENFSSRKLLIPEIIDVGDVNSDISFAISRRARGKTLNNFSNDEIDRLVKEIVRAVSFLHNVATPGTGYGGWGTNKEGKFSSWREYLEHCLDQDEEEVSDKFFYDKDFHEQLNEELRSLIDLCPEERVVLHNDLGALNMLSDGNGLTALIDWGDSMYGDPLKDVACLSFWFNKHNFSRAFRDHYEEEGKIPENFDERIKCYMLLIGYGSLWFYAYSDQEESYKNCLGRLRDILDS